VAAVAVGGVFVVPSAASYGWALLSLPVTAVLLGGLAPLLAKAGLPGLSLPFCGTALLFLYVLLLRETPGRWLVLVPVQRYSPEANLYAQLAQVPTGYVPLVLPFLGAWRCTQGYADGGPTHQGPWGQALDFAIADADGHTYHGTGQALSDYYCYNKPVLAPGDGVVEEVVQHIEDNPIGEVNTRQNWGNTIVLRHAPGVYSQLSHLRAHSARVRPGDSVRRGEVLAACGNSGRSPEPHLHFQVQATPAIGSATLAYPLAHFLAAAAPCPCQPVAGAEQLHYGAVPQMGSVVRSPLPQPQLSQALRLPPGYRLAVQAAGAPAAPPQQWEVFTDAYNARYLRCHHTGAVAYFEQDEGLFRFTAYYGPRQAWLHKFYLAAYWVPLLEAPLRPVPLPLTVGRRPWLGWVQDLVAPFFRFVRPTFELSRPATPLGLAGPALVLRSQVAVAYWGRRQLVQEATLSVSNGALAALTVGQGPAALHLTFTPVV
jgi:murein DD-endopeptidase MepM/ murein hydrolase activator NlpD